MIDPDELSPVVRERFERAGWYEGRVEPCEAAIDPHHPAAAVLVAFAGLSVRGGATVDVRSSRIKFSSLTPRNDASEWSCLLGSDLVGIADVEDGHARLYLARDERLFALLDDYQACCFFGETFASGMERVLFGRARPVLHPRQREVMLYGKIFRAGDAELYLWR